MRRGLLLRFIIFAMVLLPINTEAYDKGDLGSIMPEGDFFKKKDSPFVYYEVYKKDNLVGYCFGTKDILGDESKGFGGPIDILVGIDRDGNIENVRILEYNETPEYAAGITGPGFLGQFRGKGTGDSFKVGDDIDAVTRATISSQTVADILKAGVIKIKGILNPETDTGKPLDAGSKKIIDRLEKAGLKPREARYYRIIDE